MLVVHRVGAITTGGLAEGGHLYLDPVEPGVNKLVRAFVSMTLPESVTWLKERSLASSLGPATVMPRENSPERDRKSRIT